MALTEKQLPKVETYYDKEGKPHKRFVLDKTLYKGLTGANQILIGHHPLDADPPGSIHAFIESTAKPPYDYFYEEFLKANNSIEVHPYIPITMHWWDNDYTSRFLLGVDPAKDDTELHINVKRRNIKFNFNN